MPDSLDLLPKKLPADKNVHLDSGTRMLMVTEASASATPNR